MFLIAGDWSGCRSFVNGCRGSGFDSEIKAGNRLEPVRSLVGAGRLKWTHALVAAALSCIAIQDCGHFTV